VYYGADYYPEQWPEEVWEEDVALMREAKVNLVNVGIFAWSRIQCAEDQYDWGWLDRLLDLLHRNGIGVGLATATASPPPWAIERYPEMLPHNADGVVLSPGSRQHFAPTSPEYARLAAALVTAIAERYADHPAVKLWHVNNEYGCHLHYDYSPHAQVAFQRWLHSRYKSIEHLNAAWGTAFWSQIYTGFEQILPPRRAPYAINPAHGLDFKRFTSDALLDLYTMERDILRASGATQPITTNFMGAFPPADYWKWAREVDVIADDCYPDPNLPESFRDAAFARDLMRSLKPGTPWILMEQSTNAVNWRPTNAPKAPRQMAALSMQAVGHGADGIMFFQWRQSRRGVEKFHSAMVPHAGLDTRVWREVVQLGAQLEDLAVMPPESHARIAIVFDWECWWALNSGHHPVGIRYDEIVQRWYSALHKLHFSIDFVQSTGDLDGYALVIAPSLYLLSEGGAENLASFVDRGGHLLVTAFSDVVDENDAFRTGGFLVGLQGVLGVRVEDFGALVPPPAARTSRSAGDAGSSENLGPVGEMEAPFAWHGRTIVGHYFAEEIHTDTAEILGVFSGGRLRGRPALTRNTRGSGLGYYVATIPDDPGMEALLADISKAAGVRPEITNASEWVEAARRGATLTIINHGSTVETFTARSASGGECPAPMQLAPYDWVMIEKPSLGV
jgi:beta-galactosidase